MQPASNEEAEGQLLEKGNSLKQNVWSLWAEQSSIKYTATKKGLAPLNPLGGVTPKASWRRGSVLGP